jgi:NADPH2:quinone reductase
MRCCSITAHYLAHEYRDVQPGHRVLVHAAGGVGQVLVQLLKHRGAWVVGTTSNQAKAAVAKAAGADAVIEYGRDYTFLEELLSLTNGRGVHLAFDSVGAATLASTMKGLAKRGMAVVCGSSFGPPPAINPLEMVNPSTRLAAGSVFSYVAEPGELRRRASDILSSIRAGWLRMPESTAYNLGLADQAHRDMESRVANGKLYLTP